MILKDKQVTYISEVKFFGVWLEHNLNWDCHVENLIVQVNCSLQSKQSDYL